MYSSATSRTRQTLIHLSSVESVMETGKFNLGDRLPHERKYALRTVIPAPRLLVRDPACTVEADN